MGETPIAQARVGERWRLLAGLLPIRLVPIGLLASVAAVIPFGATGLLIVTLPFLAGCLIPALLVARWRVRPDDDELLRFIGVLDVKKETVGEPAALAAAAGIAPRRFEELLERLIPFCIFTIAWYRPAQRLYLYPRRRDLVHCPHCATDFKERMCGKCPNCRVLFSRLPVP